MLQREPNDHFRYHQALAAVFFYPIIMWLLLAGTLYALYLGMQARKTRKADAETRKELIKGKFGIRHHQVGAILLAFHGVRAPLAAWQRLISTTASCLSGLTCS